MSILRLCVIFTMLLGLIGPVNSFGAPVANLTVQAASSSQMSLSWPDGAGNIQFYYVYRNGSVIATLPGTQSTYQDSGLTSLTSYSYQVAAMSAAVSGMTVGAVCLFNGQSIASGSSVTAYQSSSVPFGQTCVSQSRLCTSGSLSGSYTYASCSIAPAPSPTPAPVATWQNSSFASQSGVFTAQFDAVPSMSTQDVVIGLSRVAAGAYDDLAAIVRFGVNGILDVRNGASYAAAASVTNVAGRSYRIRMVVDVPAKRYSVYVTPQGQAEVLIAQNYAFRSSQSTVASLANRAKFNDIGDMAISNFSIVAAPAPTPVPTPTPTPVPSPSPAPTPLAGWPDATNTGAPAGMALTVIYGNQTYSTPGQVISGVDIRGSVSITGANITLQNCKVTAANWFVINARSDTTIQDCTIDGTGTYADGPIGINGGGKILRNNIFNVDDGITASNGALVQDNYIHDMKAAGGPHYDGIQQLQGSDIIIRHNTIDLGNLGQTGAVNLTSWSGPIKNVLIENNRLLGGSYTIYVSAQGQPISGITIKNNRLRSGQFGYFYYTDGNPLSCGNVNDATGVALDSACP